MARNVSSLCCSTIACTFTVFSVTEITLFLIASVFKLPLPTYNYLQVKNVNGAIEVRELVLFPLHLHPSGEMSSSGEVVVAKMMISSQHYKAFLGSVFKISWRSGN